MKIKEYPRSIIRALYLKSQGLSKLNKLGRQLASANGELQRTPCLVSLTSIPQRLEYIHLTIRSLLCQNDVSARIVLWLNHELRELLPRSLTKLQSERFEIIFKNQFSSHRKLVFSLDEFKQSVIVTCDDDLMYDSTWLSRLVRDHERFPNDIIAHECREISIDARGELLPYQLWPTSIAKDYSSPNLLPVGYGGVLYPPRALHGDVTNQELYMRLAPKADDLWFKAMSFLNGTSVRRSSNPGKKPVPIIGAKGSSLAKTNILQDGNRIQWEAICEHYDLAPDCRGIVDS